MFLSLQQYAYVKTSLGLLQRGVTLLTWMSISCNYHLRTLPKSKGEFLKRFIIIIIIIIARYRYIHKDADDEIIDVLSLYSLSGIHGVLGFA